MGVYLYRGGKILFSVLPLAFVSLSLIDTDQVAWSLQLEERLGMQVLGFLNLSIACEQWKWGLGMIAREPGKTLDTISLNIFKNCIDYFYLLLELSLPYILRHVILC